MSSPIDRSVQAIHLFDPARNRYLYLVGEGTDQALKTYELGWLGRVWLWICIKLGCSNASMAKVVAYVAQNADQLFAQLQAVDANRLLDKIQKYNKHYPGK